MYIEAPQPVADIFYMTQCIAPGMLTLVRIDEIDDIGEDTAVRKLPRTSWIEGNKEAIVDILGEDIFSCLLKASSTSVEWTRDPYLVNRDSDDDLVMNKYGIMEIPDFAACDKECGYCGACDY